MVTGPRLPASTLQTVALGIVWAALAVWLFAGDGWGSIAEVRRACGSDPPDLLFAPAPAETIGFLDGCRTGDGLAVYRRMQAVDLVYPAVFAAAAASAILSLAGDRTAVRALALAPAGAALADYGENVGMLALVDGRGAGWAPLLVQIASAVKGIASWIAWLAVVALIVLRTGAALRRRRHPAAHGPP